MWVLMLVPVDDLDVSPTLSLVPDQESTSLKEGQTRIAINIVRWEKLHPYLLWAVYKTTLLVGDGPKADEQQADLKRELHELVIREEAWLDVSSPGHMDSCRCACPCAGFRHT